MHVPRMYLAFTSQSPPKHMACTWLSPRMNLACRQLGRPVTNQASHITPAFGRLAAFILHPSSFTSGWLWGILGVALGSHWGRIGVALGWLWGAYQLAINTLWGGFDVALKSHWGGFGRLCTGLVEVGSPVARYPLTDPGGRYSRTLCGAPHKVRYVVNLVMWCPGRTILDLLGFWHPQHHIIFCTQTIQRTPIGPFWFARRVARREITRE